jgi:hypothetical protein
VLQTHQYPHRADYGGSKSLVAGNQGWPEFTGGLIQLYLCHYIASLPPFDAVVQALFFLSVGRFLL